MIQSGKAVDAAIEIIARKTLAKFHVELALEFGRGQQ
jgi:hypothetical protein